MEVDDKRYTSVFVDIEGFDLELEAVRHNPLDSHWNFRTSMFINGHKRVVNIVGDTITILAPAGNTKIKEQVIKMDGEGKPSGFETDLVSSLSQIHRAINNMSRDRIQIRKALGVKRGPFRRHMQMLQAFGNRLEKLDI